MSDGKQQQTKPADVHVNLNHSDDDDDKADELTRLKQELAEEKKKNEAATHPTTVTGRLGQKMDALEHGADDGWNNKMFDCCTGCDKKEDCCLAAVGPCFMLRRIKQSRDGGEGDKTGWCTCVLCTLSMWCGMCYCVLGPVQCMSRRHTRQRLDRPGTTKTDCVCSFCCLPCAMVQEHNEIEQAVATGEVERDPKTGAVLQKVKASAETVDDAAGPTPAVMKE